MKIFDALILLAGVVFNTFMIGGNLMNAMWLILLKAPMVFIQLSILGVGISLFSLGMCGLFAVLILFENPKPNA